VQDALVLAVHEAVANGVEHGSGSPVRVEGGVDNGGLVVEVTTRELWVAKHQGDEAFAERGRGLTLMRGLTDELEVLVDDECVTIRLRPSRI
jgi:anti-sigma regulatory factor (Ser/Thr protein kinase)